jgi:hypothetical protein
MPPMEGALVSGTGELLLPTGVPDVSTSTASSIAVVTNANVRQPRIEARKPGSLDRNALYISPMNSE